LPGVPDFSSSSGRVASRASSDAVSMKTCHLAHNITTTVFYPYVTAFAKLKNRNFQNLISLNDKNFIYA
jgi:hypothetical protein